MKYKPGDKVRIKSLDWYNENKDENGHVRFADEVFVSDMSKFCGQEMTILCKTDYSDEAYYLEEDRESWAWTADMFEGLADETEPQEKMVSLDDVCCVLYDMLHELDINDHTILGTCEYDSVADFIKDFRKLFEE